MTGEVIGGRYRVEERLGAGGMSEVWAAHDLVLDRRVALKLLDVAADRLRFDREARAVAGLSHPNVCLLYDFGEAGERRYIVLEYLAGGSLEERLPAGRPLPDAESARIAAELAAALAHAHERGVLHRDVKPANILFDDEGNAKLADFGIARIGDAPTLTEAGTLLGTAAYISPEQARAEPVTAATDVYAFGVILYRLLTGRLPFEAEGAIELALKHVNERPAPISSLRPDAPPALERVATWALAKAANERPRDGRALVAALAQGGPALVEDETLVLRPPRRRIRPRYLAAGIALALLALAGAGLAILANGEPAQAPVAPTTRQTTERATTPAPTTTSLPTESRATTSEQTTTTTAPPPATTMTTAPTTTTEPPPPTPPPATEPLPLPTEPVTTTVGTVTVTTPTVP